VDTSLHLFPYQREGVRFLDSRNGRGLIADAPGLGKSAQALRWILKNHARALPAVVVCPASLKLNWAREADKWTDFTVAVLEGRQGTLPKAELYIVNYDVMATMKRKGGKVKGRGPQLIQSGIQTAVLDESHMCKERTAKRTQAVMRFTERLPFVIALSGTPITNRPAEFYPVISMINPDLFPDWWEYAKRYCGLYFDGFGWNTDGASHVKELHNIVAHPETGIMIRRLKEDVLTELPPKQRIVVPLQLPPDAQYWQAEKHFEKWLQTQSLFTKSLVRPKLNTIKQLAALEKIPAAVEWIADYLDQGQKLVVFSLHHKVIDELQLQLAKYKPLVMDGRTPMNKRAGLVETFQTDPKHTLIIGHLLALGVGWTLTAASATCSVELDYVPANHSQGDDRVHRIGQKSDSVFSYYLVAAETVEENIVKMLDRKQSVLNAVIDGKTTEAADVLESLLAFYKNKVKKGQKK